MSKGILQAIREDFHVYNPALLTEERLIVFLKKDNERVERARERYRQQCAEAYHRTRRRI